jgi:hypothetical protein
VDTLAAEDGATQPRDGINGSHTHFELDGAPASRRVIPAVAQDETHAVALADGNRSRQYDEHAGDGLAGGDQVLTSTVRSRFAKSRDARDLFVRQRREHLVAACYQVRRRVIGHQPFRIRSAV